MLLRLYNDESPLIDFTQDRSKNGHAAGAPDSSQSPNSPEVDPVEDSNTNMTGTEHGTVATDANPDHGAEESHAAEGSVGKNTDEATMRDAEQVHEVASGMKGEEEVS